MAFRLIESFNQPGPLEGSHSDDGFEWKLLAPPFQQGQAAAVISGGELRCVWTPGQDVYTSIFYLDVPDDRDLFSGSYTIEINYTAPIDEYADQDNSVYLSYSDLLDVNKVFEGCFFSSGDHNSAVLPPTPRLRLRAGLGRAGAWPGPLPYYKPITSSFEYTVTIGCRNEPGINNTHYKLDGDPFTFLTDRNTEHPPGTKLVVKLSRAASIKSIRIWDGADVPPPTDPGPGPVFDGFWTLKRNVIEEPS